MIDTLYIERDVYDHPRTRKACERYSSARQIICERYGEVFNPKAQNFRLQKIHPALILAQKHDGYVLPTPANYGIGGQRNFYFSHMLNCIYDCRYCFLQGMYRSAHYVLFINYEDFATAITHTIHQHPDKSCWFFSGYDCDSLAFDPLTGFADFFLPLFAAHNNAFMELRTKSTQIRRLLATPALANVIIAFSFTPDETARALEHKTPSVNKRIAAMKQLQEKGWKLGLRFDPLIYTRNYKDEYENLYRQIFSAIKPEMVHSVSLGPFRLPRAFYKNIIQLYPEEALFAGPLEDIKGMVSYKKGIEEEMLEYCTKLLLNYIPESLLHPCTP